MPDKSENLLKICLKPYICRTCKRFCEALAGLRSECCNGEVYFRENEKEKKQPIEYGL